MAFLATNGPKLQEDVHLHGDERIFKIVDRVTKNRGTDRSAIYREAIRRYHAENSHLTDEEKKDLGLN